jgi:hypothetical protein
MNELPSVAKPQVPDSSYKNYDYDYILLGCTCSHFMQKNSESHDSKRKIPRKNPESSNSEGKISGETPSHPAKNIRSKTDSLGMGLQISPSVEFRDPRPEFRNPSPNFETRGLNSETRVLNFETRGLNFETRVRISRPEA